MRLVVICLTTLAFPAACVLAQNESSARGHQNVESFESVWKENDAAVKAWLIESQAEWTKADKDGKLKDFHFDKLLPNRRFSPRYLAIAERAPEGPEAIDALRLTLLTSTDPKDGKALETRARAIKLLSEHYTARPAIMGFLRIIARYDDKDSNAFLARVIAQNPDRKIQMTAFKEQIAVRKQIVEFAASFKDPKTRAAFDKALVDGKLARAQSAKIELESLEKTFRENYSDLLRSFHRLAGPRVEDAKCRRQRRDALGTQRQGRRARHLGDVVRALPEDDSARARDG